MLRALATAALFGLALVGCTGAATPTPTVTRAEPAAPTPTPTPAPPAGIPDAPARDSFDLARRLLDVEAAPLPTNVLYANEEVGMSRTFWGLDLPGLELFELQATVLHVSDNAMWYFPSDSTVALEDVLDAAREFEARVLPGVVDLIAPGMVLPGRIAIVHGNFPGVGGYFTSLDALPRSVSPGSNERIGLYMSFLERIGEERYLGTLAHELQHLIHWSVNPTEDVWVQEGLSELASRSLGYPSLPFFPYLRQPEVSLSDWPSVPNDSLPNYAAGSLFAAYMADRFGAGWTARLVAEPLSGAAGVEAVSGLSFIDLYADWLAANIVGASAPPYGYAHSTGRAAVRRVIDEPGVVAGAAHQLAAWYMELRPSAPWDIAFEAAPRTPILPVPAYSGEACWWSNRGEAINTMLTRPLDLTGLDSATLEFRAWWDIEEKWDHGYVVVSTDDGETWTALEGTGTSTDNPLRTAFGPSYTGSSGGWRLERIDLSPFAGQEALLRFEYVTDEAIHSPGWCVDDIAIPETGFFDDAESSGDWTANGFTRADGQGVAQEFALRLVQGTGDGAVVTPLAPDEDGSVRFRIEEPATLIVTPLALKTSEQATFAVEVAEAP